MTMVTIRPGLPVFGYFRKKMQQRQQKTPVVSVLHVTHTPVKNRIAVLAPGFLPHRPRIGRVCAKPPTRGHHRYPLSTVRRVLAARPCTGLRKMTPQKGGPETVINPAKVMDGEPVPRSSGLWPGAPSAYYRETALLCFGRFA